jgi:hypothetical protein
VIRIKSADELVDPEGRFPDFEKQLTPRAGTPDSSLSVDGWIVPLVLSAPPFELPGSDLQTSSNPYTLTGSAGSG